MKTKYKKLLKKIISLHRDQDHLVLVLLGIKLKFILPSANRLQTNCCIANLETHLENHTFFPHPVGICICPEAVIGKHVHIFQNVTIGMGKYNPERKTAAPRIGDKVTIYANAVVCGGVVVGDNSVIGANSIVVKDVPPNSVVAGNPAKFIRNTRPGDYREGVDC